LTPALSPPSLHDALPISFIPDRETVIQAGDIVTLVGEVEGFDKSRRLFHSEPVGRRRIMIIGGTSLAVWLCRALRRENFSLRLLDRKSTRLNSSHVKISY